MSACDVERHSLLPMTQDVIARDLAPADLLHCAEFLTGLLLRAPLSTGANDATGWRAERWILGVLATELRLVAHESGETTPFVPRTFGTDPVARASEFVRDVAARSVETDRERERRAGDAAVRSQRIQERWAEEARP